MAKYYYIFLSVVFIALNACNKDKLDNTAVSNFLKDNKLAVDLNDPKSVNAFITDSLIKTKDIIFLSESHAVSSNTLSRLFFIKVLHQYTDTLCYFPELSFAACKLMENYILTGDESLLQFVYDNYKVTFEYTKENYAFWQQLRAYAQSLTGKKKLIIMGCDVEHQSLNALQYIRLLLGNKTPPPAIDTIVSNLKNKSTLSYRGINDLNWLKQYYNLVTVNKSAFVEFLGTNKYFDLEHTLINMQNAADYVSVNTLGFRETKLWENFKKLYPSVSKAKWFGQWGSYHTLQRANHTSIANFMKSNSESPVKDRVLTIFSFYENCGFMNQTTTQPVAFSSIEANNPYSALATTNFTLFKLDGKDSPYKTQLLWWGTDEKITDGATIYYFQYVYFVKNAPAMTPYK